MDYEQHMPGRSSYDPSRAYMRTHGEGGIGGVIILLGIVVAALALVIWMAGSNTASQTAPAAGLADPAALAPADETAPADPAAVPSAAE
ncbi:hypothetical protein QKW60_15660 [Defluviimonas aestuarii]|uniref:hypothetical protein n=1 Tax=Albidovulum aestuarii TaxID=1130726 RepID=UPI00249C9225|nr:hypothetical protein [Defluviimonas aestuarii]MDI3337853.1 hypothetical protein [Defluviimonas aestuarii]